MRFSLRQVSIEVKLEIHGLFPVLSDSTTPKYSISHSNRQKLLNPLKILLNSWDIWAEPISAENDDERYWSIVDGSKVCCLTALREIGLVSCWISPRTKKIIIQGQWDESSFFDKLKELFHFEDPEKYFNYSGGFSVPHGFEESICCWLRWNRWFGGTFRDRGSVEEHSTARCGVEILMCELMLCGVVEYVCLVALFSPITTIKKIITKFDRYELQHPRMFAHSIVFPLNCNKLQLWVGFEWDLIELALLTRVEIGIEWLVKRLSWENWSTQLFHFLFPWAQNTFQSVSLCVLSYGICWNGSFLESLFFHVFLF